MSAWGLGLWLLAAPVEGELQWNTPPGCPTADAVHSQVESLTGRPVAFDVRGVVEASEHGYRLTLELDHGAQTQTRVVEAADCQLLARAAALIVALDADPVETATRSLAPTPVQRPTPPPEPPSPLPDAVAPPDPPEPTETPEPSEAPAVQTDPAARRTPGVFEASLSGGAAFFSTPRTTGGLEAMAGWARGPLRLRVLVAHWFGTRATLEPGAGVRAAISSGGLRGCFAPRLAQGWTPVCAGLDAGALHGRGVGDQVRGRRFAEPWLALAFGVGFEARLRPRLTLPIRLEATVPVLRSRVHLRRDGLPVDVFTAPVAGLRLVAGIGLRSR